MSDHQDKKLWTPEYLAKQLRLLKIVKKGYSVRLVDKQGYPNLDVNADACVIPYLLYSKNNGDVMRLDLYQNKKNLRKKIVKFINKGLTLASVSAGEPRKAMAEIDDSVSAEYSKIITEADPSDVRKKTEILKYNLRSSAHHSAKSSSEDQLRKVLMQAGCLITKEELISIWELAQVEIVMSV